MLLKSARRAAAVTAAGVTILALSACAGGGGGAAPTEFTVLGNVENEVVPRTLQTLAEGACATEQAAMPLKVDTVPQTNLNQQVQLLAGQGGLPVMYAVDTSELTLQLKEAGSGADLSTLFDDLGVSDKIEPAARSTVESLYDGDFVVLPTEYNIEGVWYNKAQFDERGVALPTSWDELVEAAATFADAGVVPFSASGEQGWPLTRLIGNYIERDLGTDALQKVKDGDAKLTDPEYVAAAQEVADLGAAGYFGQGVGSIDYDTSINQFLNGSSPMIYMGSWILSSIGDPELNEIGEENIGFMPFPDVDGGSGDSSQLVANVGLPFTINESALNDDSRAWVKCITENYGTVALQDSSRISGFTVEGDVETSPLTTEVRDLISSTDTTVPWFEAYFSAQATTTSQQNAAQLVTGAITAEEFMTLVQGDLD
ncbi:ABC transporter substrate-binding protein [Clavibacter michiganensis]|uniref:ABC transporter substrate-binding protein n=2 Tax=Clavibacter michiganensis TaxID=28447 RepID=A0A2S5VPV7_9MICO|nr:ABC transporter substrate-binding protein [Clavibacter michiganensis]